MKTTHQNPTISPFVTKDLGEIDLSLDENIVNKETHSVVGKLES